ncbi:hypothetical protein MA16_Dca017903 [Dendrobium catenatum]|uniref:Uncharacterized protein n=1 Tax=Dendrobium catenatum TaxID=906689 RepID=A0A2I0W9T4_9ASPA|nr:hypothetical protein MA16_Dca017903 [Dendrobium catenatum]
MVCGVMGIFGIAATYNLLLVYIYGGVVSDDGEEHVVGMCAAGGADRGGGGADGGGDGGRCDVFGVWGLWSGGGSDGFVYAGDVGSAVV